MEELKLFGVILEDDNNDLFLEFTDEGLLVEYQDIDQSLFIKFNEED